MFLVFFGELDLSPPFPTTGPGGKKSHRKFVPATLGGEEMATRNWCPYPGGKGWFLLMEFNQANLTPFVLVVWKYMIFVKQDCWNPLNILKVILA